MDGREAHAAALVELNLERDRLEGGRAHAAHVFHELVAAHGLGAGRLHHKALGAGMRQLGQAVRAVHAGKLHTERLSQAGHHAHGDLALAGDLATKRRVGPVVGRLAADDADGAAHRHGARHLALDGAAGRHVLRDLCGEEGIRVVVGPELEKVTGPHGLVHAHDHGAARAALVLTRVGMQVAATVLALDLGARAREDLAHELAAVVRTLVAHELVARGAAQVGVGEVTVEGTLEPTGDLGAHGGGAELGRGSRHALANGAGLEHRVDLLAVGAHDAPHVVGRLHAALDLERAHAGVHEGGHAAGRAGVLGAQRPRAARRADVGALLVHQLVEQAAGLGTQAAVGAAAARHARHEADARIAEAQGAVAEDLELDALFGDAGNLWQGKLAGERDAVRALLAGPGRTARVMDVGLGGDVELELGPGLVDELEQAPVLDDEGVGATHARLAHEGEGASQLVVTHHDVEGHVDARSREVRRTAGLLERVEVEVAGIAARVEVVAHAAVDGVGPRSERSAKRLRPTRRRKQLYRHQTLPCSLTH